MVCMFSSVSRTDGTASIIIPLQSNDVFYVRFVFASFSLIYVEHFFGL